MIRAEVEADLSLRPHLRAYWVLARESPVQSCRFHDR